MSVTDQAGSAGDSLGSPLVADQLKMEIWSGRLPDGVRLTEADVSKKFDVSRGQAREALQRLAVQGLIRSRPNCGAIVAPAAPLPIRRLIIPIRRTIESFALDMVFEDLKDEDFSRWQENLAKMKVACEQRDFFAIAELDIAFHRQIVDRCNQPDLSLIWETLVSRIRSHFQKVQRRCKDVMDIYREHCLLIDTFRDGTRAEALKLLKAKID